ncbi:hypothetical protein [Jiangella asiatica]|uniref:Uncharacterized protein n=1 Tax=Jiangella asiatica TaxID=2530372 RepID=A0A4R5DNC4_9ACTN|nr:hypothetical protein [Jiangella asiatica]TDE12213.1 hypothetical protein E1269_07960 [Jiangella asiatica]
MPKAAEPPPPVVDWRTIVAFEITTKERTTGRFVKKLVAGRLAVRTPLGDAADAPLAPCAFFKPSIHGIGVARRLFLDEDATSTLVSVDDRETVGDEHHFRVRDGDGAQIGLVRRIPPSARPLKHTWRVDQPGRPEIVGRNEWTGVGSALTGGAAGTVLARARMGVTCVESLPAGIPLRVLTKHGGQGRWPVGSPGSKGCESRWTSPNPGTTRSTP